jgi:nucleotide-binding universal stress UspA family protein
LLQIQICFTAAPRLRKIAYSRESSRSSGKIPVALVSTSKRRRCAMRNLLLPVDFSDATERVIFTAEQLARAFSAKLWLLHCVGDDPTVGVIGEIPTYVPVPDTPLPVRFPDENRKLADLTASLVNRGVDAEGLLVGGSVIESILEAADNHQIDMIVIGSHGHGALYELLVGTVTKAVLQNSGRPTLIVPCMTAPSHQYSAVSQWGSQEMAVD